MVCVTLVESSICIEFTFDWKFGLCVFRVLIGNIATFEV